MISFYNASMAGPYHIKNNLPCQDSCFVTVRKDGTAVAACADGLGSERFSDVGSRIAARVSVEYCAEHFSKNMDTEAVSKLIKTAFINAYKAILEEAHAAGESDGEYDTTLCLAIYDGETVWYGQSGDSGMIVLQKNGEYHPVTIQQRDEDGYVFPLCSGPAHWVFGKTEQPVSCVMLMTDGIWEQLCPPILSNQKTKINIALARKFMDRTETGEEELHALEAAASAYLEHYPPRLLDDDKTIVVLYNPELPADQLEETYYQPPNWEQLRRDAETLLYPKESEAVRYQKSNEEEPADEKEDPPEDAPSDPEQTGSTEKASFTVSEPPQQTEDPRQVHLVSIAILLVLCLLAYFASGIVTKYAPARYWSTLLGCFFANASVLLPTSSLLIAVKYALTLNPAAVALWGTIGAALGETTGYLIGGHCQNLLSREHTLRVHSILPQTLYGILFLLSVLPLPFPDAAGIAAGITKLKPLPFFIIFFLGTFLKTFVCAGITKFIYLRFL